MRKTMLSVRSLIILPFFAARTPVTAQETSTPQPTDAQVPSTDTPASPTETLIPLSPARERELNSLSTPGRQVWGLDISPDGALLATGAELLTLSGHANELYIVVFDPTGARMASAGADRSVITTAVR